MLAPREDLESQAKISINITGCRRLFNKAWNEEMIAEDIFAITFLLMLHRGWTGNVIFLVDPARN